MSRFRRRNRDIDAFASSGQRTGENHGYDGGSGVDADPAGAAAEFVVAEIVPDPADLDDPGGHRPADLSAGDREAAGRPARTAAAAQRSTSRGIRLAWCGVALVAIVGLLAGNDLSTRQVAGHAQPAWFDPPGVGACVDLQGSFAVVPCDRPHDGEVVKSYGPRDPVLAASPSASVDAACRSALRAYLGPTDRTAFGDGQGWLPPAVNATVSVVDAPDDQRTGPYGWAACVVQPLMHHRYLGTVRGATAASAPDVYDTCWASAGATVPESCALPHTDQVLAVAPPQAQLRGLTVVPGTQPVPDEANAVTTPGDPQSRLFTVAVPTVGDGSDGAGDGDTAGETADGDTTGDGVAGSKDPSPAATAAEDHAAGAAAALAGRMQDAEQRSHQRILDVRNRIRPVTDAISANQRRLQQECTAVAGTVLTADDPTYGGTLSAHATVGAQGSEIGVGGPGPVTELSVELNAMYCVVSAPPGERLTRSLIGWGDRPLPLTGGH